MKPVDKTDATAQAKYARVDEFEAVDEQFKRHEKRVWKKARNRHLRNLGKQALQKEWKKCSSTSW